MLLHSTLDSTKQAKINKIIKTALIQIDDHERKNEFSFKDFFREREQIHKNPSFFMQLPYEDSSFRPQLPIKYKTFSPKFFHVTLQYHKK